MHLKRNEANVNRHWYSSAELATLAVPKNRSIGVSIDNSYNFVCYCHTV